jgi:tRNA pseudouridine55 synthase
VDLDGVLLINKIVGRTSFETLRQVKRRVGARKAGHAGTLDKSASGLLVVCLNGATAIQDLLMGQYKRYRGRIRFGFETDTLDGYGRIVKSGVAGGFTEKRLLEVLEAFRGTISQVVPEFSALHRGGERLYRRALAGERVAPPSRTVEIRELSLLGSNSSSVEIEVVASKGTYVRSLARDIAQSLGTCGYLSGLHRVSVGSFTVEEALDVDELCETTPLISMLDALHLYPRVEVQAETVPRIRNGMPARRIVEQYGKGGSDAEYVCITHRSSLVAVVRLKPEPGYLRVFAAGENRSR